MRIVAIGDQPTSGVELAVTPIAGSLGAIIGGVDLAHLDDDSVAAIRRAWLEHKVVFFRDQELTPEHFLAFAARMGELAEYPSYPASTATRRSSRSRSCRMRR